MLWTTSTGFCAGRKLTATTSENEKRLRPENMPTTYAMKHIPDQYQTTENLARVAQEANAWISHLNILSSAMEGRIRGYVEAVKSLPDSPQKDRLLKSIEADVNSIDDMRKRGPIVV